jgi:hypothetical protein
VRLHGTTGEAPRERYERDERPVMAAYLSPPGLAELGPPEPQTRQVDKTGLIAFRANQYSVPLAYPRGRVGVHEGHDQLEIYDWSTGEVIARHALACGQGEIVKNTHHYRDRQQPIADLEAAIAQRLGEPLGRRLCALLKASEPRLYKDPLQGVNRVLAA